MYTVAMVVYIDSPLYVLAVVLHLSAVCVYRTETC
jgi:hypothetical protein